MSRSVFALLFLTACGPRVNDTCATSRNGTCDEFVGCALGTDSTDCDATCVEGAWSPDLAAVCAHDLAAETPPAIDPAMGTHGSGGLVGTWDGTVVVRGVYASQEVERHYRVYVPRRYDPDVPTPVLFVLGGFGADLYWLAEFTELARTADLNDFIVVYGHPEWRDFGQYDVFAWYVYRNAYSGEWEDDPDLAYLRAVSDEVRALYNVDRTQTFVSGHSRGGMMAVIAAFEMPDVFAGFCAQAGSVTANSYDDRMRVLAPSHRFGAYVLHGIQDPDMPVSHSDALRDTLVELGWQEGADLTYVRLDGVTHDWQHQYNQQMWDLLTAHPLPLQEAAP